MLFLFLRICCLCLLLAGACCTGLLGQRVNQYHVEAGGIITADRVPFWLRANQYGTVPLQGSVARLGVGARADYRPADSTGYRPKIDWGYGVDVVANVGTAGQVLLPELYLKGRVGTFEFYAGRRREIVGLVDTLLTSGAYSWSGNALPIPKIQISLPNFTDIPFTKGILAVTGAISHGWFERADRLVTGSYLHQKHLYGRLGKLTWPFRLYGGLNHQVIWAGYSPYISQSAAVDGQLPSSIRYYPDVVLGTRNSNPNDLTITSFESNRIGNHLGSLDVGADVNLTNWNIFVYRQFLYDDGSLFYGTNLSDGLTGLRVKNRQQPVGRIFSLRQVTVEYLFTGSQGGEAFVIEDNKRRGRDNYFNHSQFLDGWTYYGRTIGTPFLMPEVEVRTSLPRYGAGIANNRVSVVHFGLSGVVLSKVNLTARLSAGRHAGTYSIPYTDVPTQFSGLLTASVPLNVLGGAVLNGAFAVDAGGLLPNSTGVSVGLRKSGLLGGQSRSAVSNPRSRFY